MPLAQALYESRATLSHVYFAQIADVASRTWASDIAGGTL
jgi:hypothetical protein